MSLSIGKLAAGVLPVVEKEIPLLKGHPEGSTVKIQLLSRARRLEIYPDTKPGDERSQLQVALDEVNNRAVPLRRERLELAESERAESPEGKNKLFVLDLEISKLEVEYSEKFEAIKAYELQRATDLIQATLTDDTGAFLTSEQATELVTSKQNEAVTKQIIAAIMDAHGVGDDTGER